MDPILDEYLKKKYLQDESAINAEKEKEANAQFATNLGRGINTISSALGGVENDDKFYDTLDTQRLEQSKQQKTKQQLVSDYIMNKYKIDKESKDAERADKRLANDEWYKQRSLEQGNDLKRLEIESRNQNARLAADDRKFQQDKVHQEKADTRNDKKMSAVNEIEERAKNIDSNIAMLDRMIEEKGTYEMMGSHNQDLDRMVDQIATDAAKLMDPGSVARPNEVELVKKNLIKAGLGNRNSTARQVLQNFKKEMQNRVDTAYKVRGIERPSQASSPAPASGGPKPGDIVDGYKFLGGDPSKQESWAK